MTTTSSADRQAAIPSEPPKGWENETPRYRIIIETHPSQNSRFKFEPPHTSASDGSYQYGDRILKRGEIVETRQWPHSAFFPLNEAAKRVLAFYNSRQHSRLPLTPYDYAGRLRLDDGLSGPLPKITAPQVQPMDLRPVRF
jgi:hypothetical protein